MKFFRKAPPLPVEVVKATESLEATGRARVELATPARTLSEILRVAFKDEVLVRSAKPLENLANQAAWAQNRSVFHAYPVQLDGLAIANRMLQVAAILERHSTDARWFRQAVKRQAIDASVWASSWARGSRETVLQAGGDLGLGDDFVAMICRFGLLPTLAGYVACANPPNDWRNADCPFCGSPALLAELRGLEQVRHLRCGLCAADWPTSRIGCPSCGEFQHPAVRWIGLEGESDRHRLQLCDTCGMRIKMIATLTPLSPPGLVAAELELVHLDFL